MTCTASHNHWSCSPPSLSPLQRLWTSWSASLEGAPLLSWWYESIAVVLSPHHPPWGLWHSVQPWLLLRLQVWQPQRLPTAVDGSIPQLQQTNAVLVPETLISHTESRALARFLGNSVCNLRHHLHCFTGKKLPISHSLSFLHRKSYLLSPIRRVQLCQYCNTPSCIPPSLRNEIQVPCLGFTQYPNPTKRNSRTRQLLLRLP